jgi:hypothetical protein
MKSTNRIFLLILCTMLLVPGYAFSAKAKPDFSGTWVFSEDKSEMGEGRFMRSTKMVVKQDGNKFDIERTRQGRDGQERTSTDNLTLDGKEVTNEAQFGTTKTTAQWSEDGTSIVINTLRSFEREGETMEMKGKEVWTLSGDGKTLTIQSESSSPRGDRKATLVYDKQ